MQDGCKVYMASNESCFTPNAQTVDFERCLGTAFGHFRLDSHHFMVTALGSCVKWPLVPSIHGILQDSLTKYSILYRCHNVEDFQVV